MISIPESDIYIIVNKGGDYDVQLRFDLTRQTNRLRLFIVIHEAKNVVSQEVIINLDLTLELGKCIVVFRVLRTSRKALHSQNKQKGGEYCIQLMFGLTRQSSNLMFVITIIYRTKDTANQGVSVNSRLVLNPGKCIVVFRTLRTSRGVLHSRI